MVSALRTDPLALITPTLLIRFQIFFGCPHRSTSTQDMEDAIGSLLYASQYPRPIGALRTIKEISGSVIEINGSFVLSKIPTVGTIVNYYSEEEDAALQVSTLKHNEHEWAQEINSNEATPTVHSN